MSDFRALVQKNPLPPRRKGDPSGAGQVGWDAAVNEAVPGQVYGGESAAVRGSSQDAAVAAEEGVSLDADVAEDLTRLAGGPEAEREPDTGIFDLIAAEVDA